jgi:hypothetical protein
LHPQRSDRIAAARNLYLAAIANADFRKFDDLVLLDFDDVNSRPIDVSAFAAARDWLHANEKRQAVFANANAFYYDVWALRHPEWSPDDCWQRARVAEKQIGLPEAIRRFVATRQIMVRKTLAPIPVDSAFGGLAIYRLERALKASYVGLTGDGDEVCEHVAFNSAVKGRDGELAIFPPLQNWTPPEHLVETLGTTTYLKLAQSGHLFHLLAPTEHPLEDFRASHPLYDRRLPELARIMSDQAPEGLFIDIGSNIGDSIALARASGAKMPAIGIEASLTYCKFMWINQTRAPKLFKDSEVVWGYAGGDGSGGKVGLSAGTGTADTAARNTVTENAPGMRLAEVAGDRQVGLVKTDTDGFDQDIVAAELAFLEAKEPVLWLEAHTLASDDEAKWRTLFARLASQWDRMILFDNFGFAISNGETAALASQAVDLMAYGRRQRERSGFRPTLYYIDIALFPARHRAAYDLFCRSIPELGA